MPNQQNSRMEANIYGYSNSDYVTLSSCETEYVTTSYVACQTL